VERSFSLIASLRALILYCREEIDMDKKVEALQRVNALLPVSKRLRMPSLFTRDYIHSALDTIEEMVAGTARRTVSAS
jgi:hypothetical protein